VDDERDDGSLVALLEVNNVNQVAAGGDIWVKTKINGPENGTRHRLSNIHTPIAKVHEKIPKHTTSGHSGYFENLFWREDKTRRKTTFLRGTKQSS